ncbi:MAG: DUF1624 domain-containing protein [Candidatus Hodarchaeota archaeon]
MNVSLSRAQDHRISGSSRIQAIDFVRGLVMILMALDHASSYWNKGRFFGEFWNWSRPEVLPDLWQFLVRFVSHWCAPTFVFLAGTSVVLFEANRINKGVQDNEITKHLAIRGLVLLLIEWTLIAWLFSAGFLYFGVLAAIGVGLIVFSIARKVDTKIILAVSLFLILDPIFAEFIWNPLFNPDSHPATFSIFNIGHILNTQLTSWIQAATFLPNWPNGLYSLDPWLGVMGLGLVFGRWLQNQQQLPDSNQHVAKRLGITGGIILTIFFIVRTIQGTPTSYFSLWASDGVLIENAFSIQNYFFMAKYPPSIVFLLWTLGGMCLVLALAFYFQENEYFQKWVNPVIIFGTTALFFYCAHLVIYAAIPVVLNLVKMFSIQITLLVWILGLLILYPMCIQYRKIKIENPNSPLKYI